MNSNRFIYKHLELGSSASYNSYYALRHLTKVEKYTDLSDKIILDIGCGNGAFTVEMAKKGKKIIGIDVNSEELFGFKQVMKQMKLNNINIFKMDAETLAFDDNEFDIVTMVQVLEHISNQVGALQETYRVLKPGGQIILSVPNKLFPFEIHGSRIWKLELSNRVPFISWLPPGLHAKIAHARTYTCSLIINLLNEVGFEVRAIDYILPPLDRIRLSSSIKSLYRASSSKIERTPLRVFGIFVLVVGKKSDA